jgi:hypothetical protein
VLKRRRRSGLPLEIELNEAAEGLNPLPSVKTEVDENGGGLTLLLESKSKVNEDGWGFTLLPTPKWSFPLPGFEFNEDRAWR